MEVAGRQVWVVERTLQLTALQKIGYLTSWTYIAYTSSLKTFFFWQTYTTLPVYAIGLSITYLDIHCGLSGTLKTAIYTVVLVHTPWWCDMIQVLFSFFFSD
jgi:hypothetical protein